MLDKRKTATITWINYNNFGTFLQAFALQQVIQKLGYENYILDDYNILYASQSRYSKLKSVIYRLVKSLISTQSRQFFNNEKNTQKRYLKFASDYLNILHYSKSELDSIQNKFDQFICGSDQIWCPTLQEHLNPYYYAGFTDAKKIAYAASFGVNQYPETKKNEFTNLVSEFSAISCRERIGCNFVENILNRRAYFVVDPTLLLSGDDWRKVAVRPSNLPHEKYLLTYFLSPNQWYLNYARDYAYRHGLKLVTFYIRSSSPQEADLAISAGPSEFVSLIEHAYMFFTDSFHGSIFATHLCTPFVGFKRFTGEQSGQNHRLTDLYAKMNILERFILDETDCARIEDLSIQNFKEMHDSLKLEIKTSLDFLKQSLAK